MPITIGSNDPMTLEHTAAQETEEKLHQEVLAANPPSAELVARWHAAQERATAAFRALQVRG